MEVWSAVGQPTIFSKDCAAVIVRANHALALGRCARAGRLWAQRQTQATGAELTAAALAIQEAAKRLNAELSAAVRSALAEVCVTAGKLQASAACTHADVRKAFLALAEAINAVGAQIGAAHRVGPFDSATF